MDIENWVEVIVEHVGAGVDHAQGAVDGEGMGIGFAAESLAEDNLEDVACGDVFFGGAHHFLKFVLGFVGVDGAVGFGFCVATGGNGG